MLHSEEIAAIVDKHLSKLVDAGINNIVGHVEPEMAVPNDDPAAEWQKWLPVKSTVTSTDIIEIEGQFGIKLPSDFISFLSHKHYYDLYISEAAFCRHPVRTWKKNLSDMVFDGYPTEYLYDRGWLPFADWSDWGLLCFDTNVESGKTEYVIGLWDHEQPDILETKHSSFIELLQWLDKESEANG